MLHCSSVRTHGCKLGFLFSAPVNVSSLGMMRFAVCRPLGIVNGSASSFRSPTRGRSVYVGLLSGFGAAGSFERSSNVLLCGSICRFAARKR